jgi:hypothetical protein
VKHDPGRVVAGAGGDLGGGEPSLGLLEGARAEDHRIRLRALDDQAPARLSSLSPQGHQRPAGADLADQLGAGLNGERGPGGNLDEAAQDVDRIREEGAVAGDIPGHEDSVRTVSIPIPVAVAHGIVVVTRRDAAGEQGDERQDVQSGDGAHALPFVDQGVQGFQKEFRTSTTP